MRKNWFERNWKWAVPSGCLTLIIIGGVLVVSAFFGITGLMTGSEPYKYAMEQVQQSQEAQALLGENIKKGKGMVSGNISYTNGDGEADLKIPVVGDKNKGTLYVVAEKTTGVWDYEILTLVVGEDRLDLLE